MFFSHKSHHFEETRIRSCHLKKKIKEVFFLPVSFKVIPYGGQHFVVIVSQTKKRPYS